MERGLGHSGEHRKFFFFFLNFMAYNDGQLRDIPNQGYGHIPAMISEDIVALARLNPPGIELCRISNMKNGASSSSSSGSGPRMETLCTLQLPSLRISYVECAYCIGEHPDHEAFSRGPLPEYAHPPRCQQFRPSMRDSIVSVVFYCFTSQECTYEVVVRRSALLAHAAAAELMPRSEFGFHVPWAKWGPCATSIERRTYFELKAWLGERSAVVHTEYGLSQICINDYNPYRIRQVAGAAVFTLTQTKPLQGGEQSVDADADEDDDDDGEEDCHDDGQENKDDGGEDADDGDNEGDSDDGEDSVGEDDNAPFRQVGGQDCRIIETNTMRRVFRNKVSTALPRMEVIINMPGCREIYMQQDLLLLRMSVPVSGSLHNC